MQHDFHDIHLHKGCDNKGFMSYGDHPIAWTKCNNADFKDWFMKKGHTCLVEYNGMLK
jgi:hypothetical protein